MTLEDIFLYPDGSARAYITINPEDVDTILSVGLTSILEAAVDLEKQRKRTPALFRAKEEYEGYGGTE